jgi:GT2 family glycosyltransferase
MASALAVGLAFQEQPQPEPVSKEAPALVSVVIPCWGQLEHTRLCVSSLLRHSRRPFELIFVDLGSLDGTPEYLAGVADAAPVRVDVVRVSGESDFRDGCTEGLLRARGESIVWLNNDTIVSSGWLQQLVALAGGHPQIGMVGPMSNCAPSPQQVTPIPYRIGARRMPAPEADGQPDRRASDLATVDRFAREWREQHRGQWSEVERLGGFCFLLKRSVLHQIDFLDDQAGRGVFDADALCGRVRQAGYHLACCRDLFIHHFGTRLAPV